MNRRHGRPLLIVMALVAGLAGCQPDPLTGPPEIRLGRDECAECGMIINEDRSACALLADLDGERSHLLFDDIGCMLDHEHEHGDEHRIINRFVRDYSGDAWVQTETAIFVSADPDSMPTPMGSGIAATADATGADRLRAQVNGRLMTFADAAAARRLWKQARLGSHSSENTGD